MKTITVSPGQALSLQFHHKREEFWKIISGGGKVVIGEDAFDAAPGKEFFVPKGVKHRIIAGEEAVVFLEISFGEFDEDDIVRLEDNYGRAKS